MPGWLGQDYDYYDEKRGTMKREKIELSVATQILLVLLTGLVFALVLLGKVLNTYNPGWQEDGLFAIMVLIILVELSAMFT